MHTHEYSHDTLSEYRIFLDHILLYSELIRLYAINMSNVANYEEKTKCRSVYIVVLLSFSCHIHVQICPIACEGYSDAC